MAGDDEIQPLDALKDRIKAHAEFFDSMLELIPPQFYFPKDPDENAWRNRFAKNKKGDAPKQAMKEASKKARKAKFDPESAKTLLQMQREQVQEANDIGPEKGKQRSKKDAAAATNQAAAPTRAKSLDELRARLHAKLENMRRQKVNGLNGRDRKRKSKGDGPALDEPVGVASRTPPKKKPKSNEASEPRDQAKPQDRGKRQPSSSEHVDAANLEFSNVEFTTGKPIPTTVLEEQRRKNKKPSKVQLLHKALKDKEQAEALKASEEGQKVLIDKAFNKALTLAKGGKVFDDPKRLKKSLKREKKDRVKSAKEWEKRHKDQEDGKVRRQEKRKENLQKHKQEKIQKKIEKKSKSAKVKRRPGFEGKKKEFINEKT